MLPEHKSVLKELEKEVFAEEVQAEREFKWIDNISDSIEFCHFLEHVDSEVRKEFLKLLDIDISAESGWEKFWEALGLKYPDLKWCNLYHHGRGPSQTALLEIQERKDGKDLSLVHVLHILKKINRLDILQKIEWEFLTDKYMTKFQNKLSDSSQKLSADLIIRKDYQPHQLLKAENLGRQIHKSKKKRTPWVLLTYASDVQDIALKVINQLRCGNGKRPKIGVLNILDPTVKRHLLIDPNSSLDKLFLEAWYVVHILSPEYLNQIQFITENSEEATNNRHIYRLTYDQYCSWGSLNYRSRAICPDIFSNEVKSSKMVHGKGIFSPLWSSSPSQIEELATCLSHRPKLL